MKEEASRSLARCPKLGVRALEKEVADLYVSFCEEDNQQKKARDVPERPKPFAAFGSFKQRHGEALQQRDYKRTIEAPAKLESGECAPRGGVSQAFSLEGDDCPDKLMVSIDGDRLATTQTLNPPQSHLKLHHKGKSFSTDLDREEAWERKKEQYLLEKEDDDSDHDEEYEGLCDELCERAAADENSCGSDDDGILNEDGKVDDKRLAVHGEGNSDGVHLDVARADDEHLHALHEDDIIKANKRVPVSRKKSCMRRPFKPLMRTRTRSLTDEDMEELRGSIDLGFGFSYSEHCNLKSTLPALELYYAINKNYDDARTRSSPVSPLDGNALVRTNSAGSASSPSSETWRISSPGDHPSQVKTRLRHWAQAVACSVKQGY